MNWSQAPWPATTAYLPSILPTASSSYLTYISPEDQTLDQPQSSKGQHQPPMISKYMNEERTVPLFSLTTSVSDQEYLYRQHQPNISYGPHPPVEGSDPEGYQGSNTFSDAYSADSQRRSSQEHFTSDLLHISPFPTCTYSIPRQSSPSSSESGNSYYGGGVDGHGVIDPSLLKSEQDNMMDDTRFDPSVFSGTSLSIDDTEEICSNSDIHENTVSNIKYEDDELCFRGPLRTDTTFSHMSMATTVVSEHESPPDCSECGNCTATEQSNTTTTTNGTKNTNGKRSKANGNGNNTHRRRKSSSTASGSESSYSDNNGEYNSRKKASKVTKKKKSKSQCRECHRVFSNQSELRKHTETHSKPYRCMYDDCQHTFGARNEWKRHVSTMHFRRELYKCTEPRCQSKQAFNRRDLFAKHAGRMHNQTASFDKKHKDYERSKLVVSDMADRSRIKREGPKRCTCGFCAEVFEGEGDLLNKMLDHVSQHFQSDDEYAHREWMTDPDVEAWLRAEASSIKRIHSVDIKDEDDEMDADGEVDD